jgi:hypothetical protein
MPKKVRQSAAPFLDRAIDGHDAGWQASSRKRNPARQTITRKQKTG